jgi:hypothetical protein
MPYSEAAGAAPMTAQHITMEQAEMICKTEAPYPLNYLPYGDDQQKVLGAIVGLLIHKRIL